MVKVSRTRKVVASVAVLSFLLAGCGKPKDLGEGAQRKEYPTYGIFNKDENKSEKVCYETSVGNVIWSLLLFETVVFPIYFIGWSINNPTRLKSGPNDNCTIDG